MATKRTIKRKPVTDRLWARVNKAGPKECWLWTGAVKANGYGSISACGAGGAKFYTHRVAYVDKKGPIPKGFCVLHRCDVPACCNPAHLFVGTQADNIRDMVAKGRHRFKAPKGMAHGRAKLTNAQARRIFKSKDSQRKLARRYGISQKVVFDIKHRKRWTHITKDMTK